MPPVAASILRRLAPALLLALLAPGALAQATEDAAPATLHLAFQPALGEAKPGGAATTVLVVKNPLDHSILLTLSAKPDADLKAELGRTEVRVPPRDIARVPLAVHVADAATPGPRTVVVLAKEAGADRVHRASYVLRVLGDAAPPLLSPDGLDLTARPGEARQGALKVTNPDAEPRRYELRVEAPPGWDVRVEPAFLPLAANETREVTVHAMPREGAHEGKATLHVGTPLARSEAPLLLRIAPPVETPPRATLRLDPPKVDLAPGGRALVHVLVENRAPLPLAPDLRFVLPDGVRATMPEGLPPVAPGATARIPLTLEADADTAEGTRRAEVRLPGAEPASFAVTVTAALPPAQEVASAEAPGPAAPDGMPPVGAATAAALAAGIGGAAALVGWVHRRWPALLAAPFVALYTRLAPSAVLRQPTRERIHRLVRERPGISFGDIRSALGLAAGMLTHHARVLEDARILFSVQDGQTRRFYPAEAGRVAPTPPLDERALQALRERGPMSASELARALGVSRQALHYHLKRMLHEGSLVAQTEASGGRELVVRAA